MLYSNTPPVKKRAPLTPRSNSLMSVSAAEHHTAEHAVLKNGLEKPSKASQSKQPIMVYSPGPPLDNKSLRSFSGNRGNMLLKILLEIKIHSQYIKVIRLLQHSSSMGDWGCIVCELESITVLVKLLLNFIPQTSHHSLTLPRARFRDSPTVTLTPGDGMADNRWSHRHHRSAPE